MGLTKAIAERLTFEAGCLGMHVTAVRFGNVLGSRGSVIPLFHQRLDRGEPVQVTHPDADRFFMTIPEAARLVLQAQSMSDGCDLYVLDMGEPVKIVDLAAAVIQQHGGHAEVRFSGLRPAEKLHEELIHSGDRLLPTICEKVMRSDHFPTCKEGVSHRVPDLLEAAEHDDREGMQRLFLEICPDFAGAVAELSGVC
jgi:FlaA1/EpsC-like NDP-sugar epimerase